MRCISVIHHKIDIVGAVDCLKSHVPDERKLKRDSSMVSPLCWKICVHYDSHVGCADSRPKGIQRVRCWWRRLKINVNLRIIRQLIRNHKCKRRTSYIWSTAVTMTAETAPHATPDPTLKQEAKPPAGKPPLTEIWIRAVVLELSKGSLAKECSDTENNVANICTYFVIFLPWSEHSIRSLDHRPRQRTCNCCPRSMSPFLRLCPW